MLCRVLAVGATLLKHASVSVSSHAGCQSCCRVKEQERLDVTRVKPTVWWREQKLRLYWRSTAANSPQERNKMTADRHWCSGAVMTIQTRSTPNTCITCDSTKLDCFAAVNGEVCTGSAQYFTTHHQKYIYFHAVDFLVILYIILLTASLWCFGPSDLNNCTRILQRTDM